MEYLLEMLFFNFGPIVFGIAGLILATHVHLKKKRDKPLVCPLKGECDVVVRSKYSKFFGIHIEVIGMIYYALIVVFYLLYNFLTSGVSDHVTFLVLGVTIGSFIFSVYLTFIQAFILRSWCTWCLFSAGFSTMIFITAVFGADIDIVLLLAKYKPFIVILHALGIALGVGAATISDMLFFRFLRDYRISQDEHKIMQTLSHFIWFVLGLVVLTGIGLYIPEAKNLAGSTPFLLKTLAVLVVIVNGLMLNLVVAPRLMDITFGEDHPHSDGELHFLRKLAFVLGAVSITTWYVIFILGYLKLDQISFGTGLSIYVLIIFIAIAVSQQIDKNMIKKYQKDHQVKK